MMLCINISAVCEEFRQGSSPQYFIWQAYTLLAGLYPPQGFQQWDPQINWQPIPVHTKPVEEELVS